MAEKKVDGGGGGGGGGGRLVTAGNKLSHFHRKLSFHCGAVTRPQMSKFLG